MRTLSRSILLLFVLPVHYAALAQKGPVSLDRFSLKQRVYLLDESGRVLVSEAKDLDKPVKIWATVPSTLKAVDILASKLWGDREQIFVTAYGLTTADSRSRLIQYSGAGERQCEWMLPEVSAGLDVDTDKHIVYLTGNTTATLYSLTLQRDNCYGQAQLKARLKVATAGRLGPIVMDSRRGLAFVGDSLKGSIYRIVLEQGRINEIARSLGQLVAMVYDDTVGRLYALDSAGRRIWLVDVNRDAVPTPTVLSRDPVFQQPVALVLASNGGLLVGDLRAKRLFLVDLAGRVTQQFAVPD